MSELKISKLTDRAGTGGPNFSEGLKLNGVTSTLVAPVRTEGTTAPASPANGDTFYDTANETYEIYVDGVWKRFIGAATEWDGNLASVTADGSFDFSSQDTGATKLTFNADGTKMYVPGTSTDSIYQYSLSTAFDISTASYDSISKSVSAQDPKPQAVIFNPDGTIMLMLGNQNDRIYEYSLSTGFDISTASLVRSFSVNSVQAAPRGMCYGDSGTKLYIVGSLGSTIAYYRLNTPYTVSSVSSSPAWVYDYSATFTAATSFDVKFNADGTKMYMLGYSASTGGVFQFDLSTAWDITTASDSGNSISPSDLAITQSMYGLNFDADYSKIYITSVSSNPDAYQYILGA